MDPTDDINTTYSDDSGQTPRISQRDLLPTATKIRSLGDIIILGALYSASATLSNGNDTVFTLTTTSIDSSRNFCIPDMSLYLTSVSSANQIPGGSNITMSQWEVIFMGNDYQTTDSKKSISKVYIRNISAGASKVVLFRATSRVINNSNII